MKCVCVMVVLALCAVPALAGAPVQGTYYSFDYPGGTFSPGHFSESWAGPGTHGQMGNTVDAQSWDGAVLGAEWRLWCTSIQTPPVLVSDTRDVNGTGEVTWQTTYAGGQFFLGAVGPWGDEDYYGDLDFFKVTTTYKYVYGTLLGIRSNVVSFGQIAGYTDCMEYTINNAAFFGEGYDYQKPAGFPHFLDEYCNTGVWTRGGWGSVTEIALRIRGDCGVDTDPSTWGKIKSLYGD